MAISWISRKTKRAVRFARFLVMMLHPLDLKLLRDIGRMKGQMIAVSVVMACGLAMMVMSRSLILSLESTRGTPTNTGAPVCGCVLRPETRAQRAARASGADPASPPWIRAFPEM